MFRFGIHTQRLFLTTVIKDTKRLFPQSLNSLVQNVVSVENGLPQKTQIIRSMSFFNKLTAEELWKGVTTVSNAGKKRGRGRGTDRKRRINLNVGQKTGLGKERMVWPGLTCPIIQSKTVINIQRLPKGSVEPPPKPVLRKRNFKVHPMERGWTSKSAEGRKIGPPDPQRDETYENFESVVLDLTLYQMMTGILGRKRIYRCLVVTGNRSGLIGLGSARGIDSRACIRLAKNRAVKKLISVDLLDKHTVNHDFFSQFGKSKIFVFKRPEGYGLKCHRAVKECCELLGIQNLTAKVEGSANLLNILRAFFLGLLRQKTYQEIADDNKLHLVEFREEQFNYPTVMASPKVCLTDSEFRKQAVEFEQYIMGGRLLVPHKRQVPFFEKLPSWTTHLKKTLWKRNHDKVKLQLQLQYGELKSHLTHIYPECVSSRVFYKRARVEENSQEQ